MEKMNLRKGLFGYTESSVVAYIEAINGEMKARIQKLTEENDGLKERCELYESEKNSANDKQDVLLEKINLLSKEKEDMQTEIAGLTEKYQISIQDLMKQQRINLIMRKVRANLLT